MARTRRIKLNTFKLNLKKEDQRDQRIKLSLMVIMIQKALGNFI